MKIELVDDNARLPKSSRGMFEIHLSNVGYGTLSRAGTLPRRGTLNVEKVNVVLFVDISPAQEKRRRSAEIDGLNYEFGEMPGPTSHVPSSRGTVFSRQFSLFSLNCRLIQEGPASTWPRCTPPTRRIHTALTSPPSNSLSSSLLILPFRISGLSSSVYEPLPHRMAQAKRRKPRERYRRPYVPSTKGSATESR